MPHKVEGVGKVTKSVSYNFNGPYHKRCYSSSRIRSKIYKLSSRNKDSNILGITLILTGYTPSSCFLLTFKGGTFGFNFHLSYRFHPSRRRVNSCSYLLSQKPPFKINMSKVSGWWIICKCCIVSFAIQHCH